DDVIWQALANCPLCVPTISAGRTPESPKSLPRGDSELQLELGRHPFSIQRHGYTTGPWRLPLRVFIQPENCRKGCGPNRRGSKTNDGSSAPGLEGLLLLGECPHLPGLAAPRGIRTDAIAL